MFSVEEAFATLLRHPYRVTTQKTPLLQSMHCILAEDIFSDRPAPPYDRVAMDGIAVLSEECSSTSSLAIKDGLATAGMPQYTRQHKNSYVEVATGAILPSNTDAVIPYEYLTREKDTVTWNNITPKPYLNVHPCGSDYHTDTLLLKKGTYLQSQHISLLASVGKEHLATYAKPKILIITTGNEIVPITTKPEIHQIRASNSLHIASFLHMFGFPFTIQHTEDTPAALLTTLEKFLSEHDIILSLGGVSKGIYDVVKLLFKQHNITPLFDAVSQRPGKPFSFAMFHAKPFFALPGNPLACVITARRYLLPYLYTVCGADLPVPYRTLAEDYSFPKKLSRFLLVTQNPHDDSLLPLQDTSSGNYTILTKTSGFLELPLEDSFFPKGSQFPYYSWNSLTE